MLTSNVWAEVGLCNGSFGVVEQFWYAEAAGPLSLPIAVLVHFPGYTGPTFINACENCLLVTTTNSFQIKVCNDHPQVAGTDFTKSCR